MCTMRVVISHAETRFHQWRIAVVTTALLLQVVQITHENVNVVHSGGVSHPSREANDSYILWKLVCRICISCQSRVYVATTLPLRAECTPPRCVYLHCVHMPHGNGVEGLQRFVAGWVKEIINSKNSPHKAYFFPQKRERQG